MRIPRQATGATLAALALTIILAACGQSATPTPGAPARAPDKMAGSSTVPPLSPAGSGAAAAPAPLNSAINSDNRAAAVSPTSPAHGSTATATIVLGATGSNIERNVHAGFTVSHGTFMSSFDQLLQRAVDLGGSVASTSTSPDTAGNIVAGTVVLRVPSAQLAAFITGINGDFHTSFIDFTTIDHTGDMVDATAGRDEAKARLDALKALVPSTTNINDLNRLNQQIIDAQHACDVANDALLMVTDKTTMSTATVDLAERGSPKPVVAAAPSQISSAAHSGWDNDIAALAVAIEVALTILPYLMVGLVALATRRFWLSPLLRVGAPRPGAPLPPGGAATDSPQAPITM